MEFVWNITNVEHIAEHGIEPHEAEYVIENARPPYPRIVGNDKRLVVGQLRNGRYVQAIYVPSRSVRTAVYVIHCRGLTEREKKRFRRRMR